MRVPRVLLRLPAYVLNGIGVALCIALIQGGVGLVGGTLAALTASAGGIFASLADLPLAPGRTWRRVATAAAIGCTVSVLVAPLQPWPVVLGCFTVVLAFVSSMLLAWGVRAGPISFVGILALVFTMATAPPQDWRGLLVHAGWTALGGLLYLGLSLLLSNLLQQRYRTLALSNALKATARLLSSRASLLIADPLTAPSSLPLQGWIEGQAALDERLQAARDFLFAAPESARVRRQVAILLLAIDLRDTLMASELDLDLLGRDAAADQARESLAANMNEIAHRLINMAAALKLDEPLRASPEPGAELHRLSDPALFPAGDPRVRLAAMLQSRAHHMVDDLLRMRGVQTGGDAHVPLAREELQLFVSPEGWPLAALKAHLTLSSPVMRHALRAGVALGSAYFIAHALPWSSHPHWLVLSVGVVLRGNLEQTLARRDARVAGTVVGCVVVLMLAQLNAISLSTLVYLAAAGTAHAFVTRRYLVASAAASVMALLQAHLAHPAGGFGVGERLADTIIGALLAWGFSYMLPWWERRSLDVLVRRVLKSLSALSKEALRWPDAAAPELKLRLARRDAYDAIGGIAASAQRTGVEPERVQVPLYALATLLVQCHVLLAQLAAIRAVLSRRTVDLDRPELEPALGRTAVDLERLLDPQQVSSSGGASPPEAGEAALPPPPSSDALTPWVHRRLDVTTLAAARVAQAARALRAAIG